MPSPGAKQRDAYENLRTCFDPASRSRVPGPALRRLSSDRRAYPCVLQLNPEEPKSTHFPPSVYFHLFPRQFQSVPELGRRQMRPDNISFVVCSRTEGVHHANRRSPIGILNYILDRYTESCRCRYKYRYTNTDSKIDRYLDK